MTLLAFFEPKTKLFLAYYKPRVAIGVIKPFQCCMRVHVGWFCDGKVIDLLSLYSITVVYMPGTSINCFFCVFNFLFLSKNKRTESCGRTGHCGSRVTLRLGSRQRLGSTQC